MPSSVTTVFSVKEAWAYPLLQDVEGALPVYGLGKRIYGIQNISRTENLAIVPQPGDGTVIDTQSEVESVELSAEYGKMSHSLDTLIKGGLHRIATSESQHIFGGSDQGGKFCLKFRATKLGAPGCDYVITMYALVAGTTARGSENKAFQTNTFDMQASQLAGKVLHPDGNDWYIEQVRDPAAVEAIDPLNALPTLPSAFTALTIASTSIAEAAVDVAITASPTVTFSEALAAAYVNDNYFYLVAKDGSGIVPAAVSQATATVTVNPTASLVNSTEYVLVVDASVASAANLMALGARFELNFTTVAA
jgi:hypothetical protein